MWVAVFTWRCGKKGRTSLGGGENSMMVLCWVNFNFSLIFHLLQQPSESCLGVELNLSSGRRCAYSLCDSIHTAAKSREKINILGLLISWYLHFHRSLHLTRTWIINLKREWASFIFLLSPSLAFIPVLTDAPSLDSMTFFCLLCSGPDRTTFSAFCCPPSASLLHYCFVKSMVRLE